MSCRTDLESTVCLSGWKITKNTGKTYGCWRTQWQTRIKFVSDILAKIPIGKFYHFFIGWLYADTCCLNLFIRAVISKMWPRHLIHSETIVLKLCWFSASKQVGTCHSQCADNIYCLWTDWKDASCVLSLSPMVGVALNAHREREREGQRIFKESSAGLNLIQFDWSCSRWSNSLKIEWTCFPSTIMVAHAGNAWYCSSWMWVELIIYGN